jgi:hypothetical protein
MMKHQNIKLLLVLLLSMTNMVAFADEVNGINYGFSGTEATVTSGSSKYSGNVVIPESVTYNGNTYSVTSIGEHAFYGYSGLTSVTIPNSVTSIGGSAFYGTAWYNNQPVGLVYAGKVAYKYKGTMPSNTSIVIEEGTLEIARSAFDGCSGLTSVTIPNSVTSIEGYAFSRCSGLTSVTCEPTTPPSIDTTAFNANASGRKIYVPSASVNAYKNANNWSTYASDIEAISA